MKKISLISVFLILCCGKIAAQLELDGGLGFLYIEQTGYVLIPHDPNSLFYHQQQVNRNVNCWGGTMTAFYSIKPLHIYYTFPFSYGPQLGMGYYYSKPARSYDPAYMPKEGAGFFAKNFGVLHWPLAFSCRFGKLVNPDLKTGISVSAGAEIMYMHIPDEKGFAALPSGEILGMIGKHGLRLTFFFMPYKSVFETNLGYTDRLQNKMFRMEYVRTF